MKIPISPVILAALAVNISCLAVVATATVGQRLKSDAAIATRTKSLNLVAEQVLADSCWKSANPHPYKLGDLVDLDGSADGKSPTSCIFNPPTSQFVYVTYTNGQLTVAQAFTRREVRNQISIIKQGDKLNER